MENYKPRDLVECLIPNSSIQKISDLLNGIIYIFDPFYT